jgi:hypothetical protein
MSTTTAERQKAEIARQYPGWTIWTARGGSPAATRTGGQRPPQPDDGTWAATLLADDWADLTAQLATQAQYDAERTYDIAG